MNVGPKLESFESFVTSRNEISHKILKDRWRL